MALKDELMLFIMLSTDEGGVIFNAIKWPWQIDIDVPSKRTFKFTSGQEIANVETGIQFSIDF